MLLLSVRRKVALDDDLNSQRLAAGEGASAGRSTRIFRTRGYSILRFVRTLGALTLSAISLSACGSNAVTLPDSSAVMRSSASHHFDRHVLGCPPSTPGIIAQQSCPEIVLKVVGGRMLTADNLDFSTPPREGYAVFFSADGTFLYAERHRSVIRQGAAMELDVFSDPSVQNIEKYQWTLYHQGSAIAPFVNRLQSVQEVGFTFLVRWITTPSYFVSDGTGRATTGTVENTHGFDVTLSYPPTTPLPISLLTFSTKTPESKCGQCWEVLWH